MIRPIVDASWLAEHRSDVVVCDVRTTMAGEDPQEAFAAGHLPGARFVSLDTMLSDPPGPVIGRHPLPAPDAFARTLGDLGIGTADTVVAYDTRGGAFAARLVWMLRIIGQDAALLDGGLDAWPGELETGAPAEVEPVDRTPVAWSADALADADDVAAAVAAGTTVIDSREPARYRGEMEPIDAVAGHVPGAINLPFAENLEAGRFRDRADLAERFVDVGEAPIVYCGSGVTACHNALAIEHAGRPLPRVYVGSWSGWSTDPDRPVA